MGRYRKFDESTELIAGKIPSSSYKYLKERLARDQQSVSDFLADIVLSEIERMQREDKADKAAKVQVAADGSPLAGFVMHSCENAMSRSKKSDDLPIPLAQEVRETIKVWKGRLWAQVGDGDMMGVPYILKELEDLRGYIVRAMNHAERQRNYKVKEQAYIRAIEERHKQVPIPEEQKQESEEEVVADEGEEVITE